jgi:hypothetical protein
LIVACSPPPRPWPRSCATTDMCLPRMIWSNVSCECLARNVGATAQSIAISVLNYLRLLRTCFIGTLSRSCSMFSR